MARRAAAAREAAAALPALLRGILGAAEGPLGAALRHAAPVRLAKAMAAMVDDDASAGRGEEKGNF